MKITVCSLFRDSQVWHGRKINQVDRYFSQFNAQGTYDLDFHLMEGNSVDDTYDRLQHYRSTNEITLHKCDVIGSEVESTTNAARLINLSRIANIVLKSALDTDTKVILWIESDFIFQNDLLNNLTKFMHTKHWDNSLGVSPIPMLGEYFYDTWAFKDINGQHFSSIYAQTMFNGATDYVKLLSVGCCCLFNADNIRKHGIDFGTYCFRHLCEQATKANLSIWCDPKVFITHPGDELVASRWI